MPFAFPWLSCRGKGPENVGLISLGSIDEKIPLILYPLLLSADITLGFYRNYHFPPSRSSVFLEEIKSFLQKIEERAIVFDLRVQDWLEFQTLRKSRKLGHTLQGICSFRHISSSVILSSGSQQLGSLMGIPFEVLEAREVLDGKGPFDLAKFALELGSDFLLLTKKIQHKMEANSLLREKIVSGEASSFAGEILGINSLYLDAKTKMRIYSPKEGYLHHWNPKDLLTIKRRHFSSLPGGGFSLLKKHRDKIKKGEAIAEAYLLDDHREFWPEDDFKRACIISTEPPDFRPFILERFEMRFF